MRFTWGSVAPSRLAEALGLLLIDLTLTLFGGDTSSRELTPEEWNKVALGDPSAHPWLY